MTENIKTEMPVTISIDMDAFVNHIRRTSGGWDEDEPQYALDPIAKLAVDKLVAELRKDLADEIATAARDEIRTQVREAVIAALDDTFQPVNEYGSASGSPTSLREQIGKEIKAWSTVKRGDSYNNNRKTAMEEFVAKEVAVVMNTTMKEVLASEKEALKQHMRDVAASLLAAEATKR